tara:strand:+ start:328 stop:507 length:180 start_codon:yes stop_codon:yes gene_type:complete
MSSSLIQIVTIAAYKAIFINVDAQPPFNLKIGSISNEFLTFIDNAKLVTRLLLLHVTLK